MARQDKTLSESFTARGVHKKVADELARAANGNARPRVARMAAPDLAAVVAEIRHRLDGGEKRAQAASKAARTRKREARLRSESVKEAARFRARA